MEYQTLSRTYYKNSELHSSTYEARFNAPNTKHFDFNIKQFNHKQIFPAFLCYTEELVLIIDEVYKKYEDFLSMINFVPEVLLNQFTLSCIVDEVKSTNEIEGTHSTRHELKEILENTSKTSRFASVIGKYVSILGGANFKFLTCEDVRQFYDEFIHEEVVNDKSANCLDGKIFRKGSVDIDSGTGKTIHRGVYPEEKIIDAMNQALLVLNDSKIPVLVRIAVFHYFFEYIHPFYDGNGRTARFIASYYLAKRFHCLPALRLSITIKKQLKKYYKLFQETDSEINCGDLTPFVTEFISMISATFDDIISTLDRKMNQLVKYQEKFPEKILSDKISLKLYQILLQAGLFFAQGVSMDELIRLTGVSRNTIKSRLSNAPKGQIIITGKRKHYYRLNMMIFKDSHEKFRKE